jgi:hypothetical protein
MERGVVVVVVEKRREGIRKRGGPKGRCQR